MKLSLLFGMLVMAGSLLAADYDVYVGTYTKGDSRGIYRVRLDGTTGKLTAKALSATTDNPAFLDTYAWVLYSRAKFKDARKAIERAISTGKVNATHLEHYGDILFQLGDVDGAVQQWEKARGLNANSETLNKKIVNRKIYE